MQRLFRTLNLVDWLVASACLAYGLWTSNLWWLVGGVVGLFVAWWRPAERVKGSLERRLVGRRPSAPTTDSPPASASATTAQASATTAQAQATASAVVTSAPAPLAPLRLRPGHVHPRVSKDKHNQLVPEAINRFEVPTRLRE